MSTKRRKGRTTSSADRNAGLRSDVQEAIARVWPDGIVELPFEAKRAD